VAVKLRRCLSVGVLVVLADLLALGLSRTLAGSEEVAGLLMSADQMANVALFAYLGYLTGKETGSATSSAEAGVIASVLPACAAIAVQLVLPPESVSGGASLGQLIVENVALNVAIGGVSALLFGWVASRNRTPVK
jgi:hypothetical protein